MEGVIEICLLSLILLHPTPTQGQMDTMAPLKLAPIA